MSLPVTPRVMAEAEVVEKARFLCTHRLLYTFDSSRFPSGMRPEDYIRPEDLSYLRLNGTPRATPSAEGAPLPPARCDVMSSDLAGDAAVVRLQRTKAGASRPETVLANFIGTPVGWRLGYWLPERARFDVQTEQTHARDPDDEMTLPQKVSGPEAGYTVEAAKRGVEGLLVLRCIITREGAVEQCQPLKTLPRGLTEETLRALQASRYTPALFKGEPIAVRFNFFFLFLLPGS
ncbi:energy transducer TonB [Corallococcus llansteffanensis]|uniref:energy transducer TonB n=1 Tax=Corallococcus llansteffanensis TaxID=2316731 RepID=UPI00131592D2|nr:energy transducer TonB [Corallococcus llansteffanensis]